MRDLRRLWLSSTSKLSANALVFVSLTRGGDLKGPSSARGRTQHAADCVKRALGEVGAVYTLSPQILAVLMRDRTLRDARRIAEQTLAMFEEAQLTRGADDRIHVAAGLAPMHRDDDPQRTIQIAATGLLIAGSAKPSRVVCERDLARLHARMRESDPNV